MRLWRFCHLQPPHPATCSHIPLIERVPTTHVWMHSHVHVFSNTIPHFAPNSTFSHPGLETSFKVMLWFGGSAASEPEGCGQTVCELLCCFVPEEMEDVPGIGSGISGMKREGHRLCLTKSLLPSQETRETFPCQNKCFNQGE